MANTNSASLFAANLAIAAVSVVAAATSAAVIAFFVVAMLLYFLLFTKCICKFMTACFGIKGARSYTTCFPLLDIALKQPRSTPRFCAHGRRRSFSVNCFNARTK
ncbi:unnamed protein product [Ceratitis capitata]|uniref:(Mediterranean fruit fly) hypothetical protein n=1 Tax=Ceratitis capitata TaxID=7213 RepID=A0A811UYE1_CERCA|nr:unnamed protein product [Ceratitis capitata]